MKDRVLREQLARLLSGGQAHASPQEVLRDIDPSIRTSKPPAFEHSLWELLEHLRIAQEDILRYTLDPGWVSPDFPAGYWPSDPRSVSESEWSRSCEGFFSDLAAVVGLVRNPEINLSAAIPHGGDHTYLREILLVADHNAYHLGQMVQLRRALGAWD